MPRYEEETGSLTPEVRPANSDEVKAVVDAIDLLLHIEGEEPRDEYDNVIPLIPVQGMTEFGMKRVKGETLMVGTKKGSKVFFQPVEVAQVQRNWGDQNGILVVHLLQTVKGYSARRVAASDFSITEQELPEEALGAQLRTLRSRSIVTPGNCSELVRQLHSTRILR